MKLLSTMAAIRLEEDGDNIENTLSLALVDTSKPGTTDRSIQSSDPLASSSWERVTMLYFTCQIMFPSWNNTQFLPSSLLKHIAYVLLRRSHSWAGCWGEDINYPCAVQKFVEAIQSWNWIYSHASHSCSGIATIQFHQLWMSTQNPSIFFIIYYLWFCFGKWEWSTYI